MKKNTIAVINGANINILGDREPQFYGRTTLPEILRRLTKIGEELDYNILCYQSNSQGEIVDFIQENSTNIDGLILNPAGFSKTGYPILDVITAFKIPFIEVHLSNIFAREKWHAESIFAPYSLATICGFKARGYEFALKYMHDVLSRKIIGNNEMKAVCFDFDGVVIDSLDVQKEAFLKSYQQVAGNKSLPSVDDFFSYSGEPLAEILAQMNLPQDMLEPYRKISNKLTDKIKVHNGMLRLLQKLKQTGIKCGLCTGKDRERTVMILKKKKLYCLFDEIVCSDEVKKGKPDAESLLKLIGKLGVEHRQAIMVGDSHNDIECANAASVQSIGVAWGEVNCKGLMESGPDYIASTIQQLQFYIEKIFDVKLNLDGEDGCNEI